MYLYILIKFSALEKNMKKLKLILTLCLSISLINVSHASALDISGQSIGAFLQEGNYAEISYSVIDSDIEGKQQVSNHDKFTHTIDLHNQLFNTSIKKQLSPKWSLGLIYDQPFQLDSNYYEKSQHFKAVLPYETHADIDTENLTFLMGYQHNPHFGFFAGPVYQSLKGNFDLSGEAFGFSGHYTTDFKQDEALGYVVGATYNIPKFHFKMDLSYRSEVKHALNTIEQFDVPILLGEPFSALSQTKVNTPESINMNIQMGIYYNTLLMVNTRWVNWNTFSLKPELFSQAALFIDSIYNGGSEDSSLLRYNKDQWSLNLGLARKFSDQWSAFVFSGRDSGDSIINDNSRTENWLTGIIFHYKLMQKYELSAGAIYIKLEDSTQYAKEDNISNNIGEPKIIQYSDNSSFAYVFKLGYRF